MAMDTTSTPGALEPGAAAPVERPRSTLDAIRPLLADSVAGGIPPQTTEQRLARERAYNLFSAAIGACTARGLRDRAAELLAREARSAFLTPAEIEKVNEELAATLAELRATPAPSPTGVTPESPNPLTDEVAADLFDLALRGRLTGPAREHPRALLFGGQPGSGKSTLQRLLLPALPEGTVSYDGDDLLRTSPDYEWAMGLDDRTASRTVARQVGVLHGLAMEHIRAGRVDVLCSHPLGRADWAAEWVGGFRAAEYRVEVAFVAVHASNSRFSLMDRHRRSREDQGFGRWLPETLHDRFYQGVPNTIEFLETHRLVDSLYVLSRDGEVLYANHLGPDGDWRSEPFGRIALEAERGRRELWHGEDAIVTPPHGAP
ncbi:zeta toxin family protein [Nocardiopsis sp. DSM 44743]|uniref:UDP-N-acetylglucosamine kinase n=2 Tax=Nocardiopsis lambiniae TaxID=3075539 RepID=A0ABU2M8D2_9ACTN|nr:zeta toxin family protein [Nocardiopsis sp. DSM 44743]MDT0328923.1 zeta toxin family protein [Nocardiopsis sp. DSM 44743]